MFDKNKKYSLQELYKAGYISPKIFNACDHIASYNKHRINGHNKTNAVKEAAVERNCSERTIWRALNEFGD